MMPALHSARHRADWHARQRANQAASRRIDPAFTDLMIVAVPLLPGAAPFADRTAVAEACSNARESAHLPRWPQACLRLLEACESIAAGKMSALRNGEIGAASSAEWPEPTTPRHWQDDEA